MNQQLGRQGRKKHPGRAKKEKRIKKNEVSLKSLGQHEA